MTHDPLVEAVAISLAQLDVDEHGLEPFDEHPDEGKEYRRQQATAALRAIEDAGYEIKKVGDPNLKG